MTKTFLDLRVLCAIFALWSFDAVARFLPVNGGMANQQTVITTAATTTTAVATSNQVYVFEGTQAQTFQLPNATKLPIDWWYSIINNSTGSVTVKDGSGATIKTLLGGEPGHIQMSARGNSAGTWKIWPSVAQSNLFFKPDFISFSNGVPSSGFPIKTNAFGLLDFTFFGASLPLTTKGDILSFSTSADRFPVGSDGLCLLADSTQTFGIKWASCVSGSSVASISVASANGLNGSSSGGSTPVLTLGTSITGILKGNGTAISAAVSATDYAPATVGSSILKGNGAGGFSNASSGTDYEVPLTFSTGLTRTVNTVTVNSSQSIATLSNLTTNGYVRTSGGGGTLNVDTPSTAYVTLYETIATTLGDLTYGGASGTPTRLAGDTSNTKKFLTTQSSSAVAAAPSWGTIATSDVVLPTTSAIPAGANVAIDWNILVGQGGAYTRTLAANTTFTFTNPKAGQTIVASVTNTASNFTVTWSDARLKWSGGTTPTQTVGAKTDVYTFIFDGTSIYGSVIQNF